MKQCKTRMKHQIFCCFKKKKELRIKTSVSCVFYNVSWLFHGCFMRVLHCFAAAASVVCSLSVYSAHDADAALQARAGKHRRRRRRTPTTSMTLKPSTTLPPATTAMTTTAAATATTTTTTTTTDDDTDEDVMAAADEDKDYAQIFATRQLTRRTSVILEVTATQLHPAGNS